MNEDSVEEVDEVEDLYEKKPEDARSTFTYVTEASTVVNAPLSQVTTTSSKLELQLDFLAKELELEKQKRVKLAGQVSELKTIINENKERADFEIRDI